MPHSASTPPPKSVAALLEELTRAQEALAKANAALVDAHARLAPDDILKTLKSNVEAHQAATADLLQAIRQRIDAQGGEFRASR